MDITNKLNEMLKSKYLNKSMSFELIQEIKVSSLQLIEELIVNDYENPDINISVRLTEDNSLNITPSNLFTTVLMAGLDEIPANLSKVGKLSLENADYEVKEINIGGAIGYESIVKPKELSLLDLGKKMFGEDFDSK